MESNKRYSIKKILFSLLWLTVGVGTTVLLVAAMHNKDQKKCKGVIIKISGIENNDGPKFVDEEDILNTVKSICIGDPKEKAIGSFDLNKMEAELGKSKWVKNAELFFDNNEILKVNLQEREPVARVFTTGSTSFYIDTALAMLPLSDKFSARLPVFTGFPSDKMILTKADSSLLNDVKNISLAIQKDSFVMAMVDQVDITPQQNFEIVPKIGNQLIVFGNGTDVAGKFNRLQLFYKQVMVKAGWNKYSVINVQYRNQVIAKIKSAEDKTADSVRALQMMQVIASNAQRQAEDSIQTIIQDNNSNTADSSIIQHSIQREDNFETSNTSDLPLQPLNNKPVLNPENGNPLPPVKPVAKPVLSNPIPAKKPTVVKSATTSNSHWANNKPVQLKKPTNNNTNSKTPVVEPGAQKPKAIMPNKNDY